MFIAGSLVINLATGMGLVAASVAVFGFLLHVAPVLSGASEEAVRRATVAGGLIGVGLSVFVILLSAFTD
jgi:hypothetical protein